MFKAFNRNQLLKRQGLIISDYIFKTFKKPDKNQMDMSD